MIDSRTIPALLSQGDSRAWMFVAAIGLLGIYLMMRPRKKRDPTAKSLPLLSLSQQRTVEKQMSNLLVEFAEMARQMSAQLDTRAAKLEMLIQDADRRLAALKAATRGAASANGEAPIEDFIAPADGANDPSRDGDASVEFPEGGSIDPRRISGSPRNSRAAEAAPAPIEPKYADVYAMADEGRSAFDIARHLSRPAGEIELILALRPRS